MTLHSKCIIVSIVCWLCCMMSLSLAKDEPWFYLAAFGWFDAYLCMLDYPYKDVEEKGFDLKAYLREQKK